MSSSVCQGLQSCLEPRGPRLVEPSVLIHNLAPPKMNLCQSIPWPQKPNVSQPKQGEQNEIIHTENDKNIIINKYYSFVDAEHESNKDGDSVWCSIQALTNTCQHYKQPPEAEQSYVHPLVKRSSSRLSTKSLEMCTESLGSETGSCIDESIDDFPSPLLERRNFEAIQRSRSREFMKKFNRSVNFPPPLTSISGLDGVQVRPLREGGRLVLKAVTVSSCTSYFQAERANGRLRLSLLKDGYADSNSIDCNENEENAYNLKRNEEEDEEENEITDEEEIESEDADTDAEDDAKNSMWEDDLGVNDENVGYEIGVGEFPRPTRCKEGGNRNKGMTTWGPFWVAIS